MVSRVYKIVLFLAFAVSWIWATIKEEELIFKTG